MIDRFLKAKHWQIFIIVLILPLIVEIFAVPSVERMENPALLRFFMPFRIFIMFFGYFAWLWSISIGMQQKVPQEMRKSQRKFKAFMLITLFYLIFILGFMGLGSGFKFGGDIMSAQAPSGGLMGGLIGLVVPLIFPIYCVFYFIYFASKSIKTAELMKDVNFNKYSSDFFLLLFFPIGIWSLQPKINGLIKINNGTAPLFKRV